MEKWYSCYWVQCEALLGEWKEISTILFRKHDHEHVVVWFLNSKKSKWCLKNHEICQDLMILYVVAMVKKLRMFRTICHVRCLQTKVSHKKNYSVEKDSVKFGVKVMIELGLTSKLFVYVIENIDWFLCNFGNLLDPFDNSNLLSVIKDF